MAEAFGYAIEIRGTWVKEAKVSVTKFKFGRLEFRPVRRNRLGDGRPRRPAPKWNFPREISFSLSTCKLD